MKSLTFVWFGNASPRRVYSQLLPIPGLTASAGIRGFLGALLFLCATAPNGHAADDWFVPEAGLRFKVELGRKPSHPSAGYFASLPDGGIFRGTTPVTTVATGDGKVLASSVLWHNPETGFSLVFAAPDGPVKFVYVYLQPSPVAKVWKPNSGLTPSAILCTHSGRDTLAAGQALANFGRVESGVHWGLNPGHPRTAFTIGGDHTGRPRPAAFYLLSYLDAPVAGNYWIAPMVHTGQVELWVDGAKLPISERSKLWAGTGAAVDLNRGLHRVEIVQTAPGSGPFWEHPKQSGVMYLTWRPPNEKINNGEARVLKPSEIVQSGHCTLSSVEARDGSPVAVGRVNPGLVYWFGDEDPLLIYEFNALTSGHPPGTSITWTFQEGGSQEGSPVKWIIPGFREGRARLTVKSGQSISSCIVPFFGFSTNKTSLEQADHRAAFRDTLAEMVSVYPKNPDPVANWSDAWWNNIFRTVEGGKGERLMTLLFGEHFEALRKRLAPGQMSVLQDVFLDVVLRDKPEENFKWLMKFFVSSPDVARQNELRFREGELHMYYLNDRKRADNLYKTLATVPGEIGELAKVRLGDLALLSGDLNKATSFYADVQNRARLVRNTAPARMDSTIARQLLGGGPSPAQPVRSAAPDQKGGALQEVSLAENVRHLTETGFLLEARQALRAWEGEFPLSKISGDFILCEAEIYMKLKDWKRAQQMLEAYCREIDASSYLPEAVSMLIQCVDASQTPPASIRDIVDKVKGRLKFHPVANKLETFLQKAGPAPK